MGPKPRHVKIGKENVHPKVLFRSGTLTSEVPMLQNLKTGLKKNP